MATYRTIRMDFWNDPYVEGMEPQDKLLYVYLFSSPHTNNLGVLTVSRRKIAFETGLTEEGVAAGLAVLERDGKVLIDGGAIWVCNFVRHQCTTSPKLLLSLRALFPTVSSGVIRRAICDRYPHIFAPADTVSVPTGESEKKQEREKEDRIGTDGFFVPVEMLEALQRDFPDVDVQAEIPRIRDWQSEKRTPIRNVWRFLRAWLSNAKTGKHRVPRREAPVSVAASQFRAESFPPSPEALAENCDRGLAWCRRILNREVAA